MEDRALYQAILGLAVPWTVERVELRDAEQSVQVFVEAEPGTVFQCPDCGAAAPVYDYGERCWRHLDTCQFTTLLVARVPRVQCGTDGVKTVRAVGREGLALYAAVRTAGHRVVEGGDADGRGTAAGPDVGGGARDPGAGRAPRTRPPNTGAGGPARDR